MNIITSKQVIIRKERECWGCERIFAPKSKMLTVVCADSGEITKAYWCERCQEFIDTLELWEKEDGFGKGDLLNYDEYREEIAASPTEAKEEE